MTSPVPTFLLIAICGVGAIIAKWIGLPLPYLLGPLAVSGLLSILAASRLPTEFPYLSGLRLLFIAVIGLMIGAQVSLSLFSQAHGLAISLLALTCFVLLCIGYNYVIFHHVGNYDPATAFYSSAPGGLYESIAFGEEAGADTSRLVLQQFLRVIMVVTLLPIGLSLWHGAPVGSAAGMSLAGAQVPLSRLPTIALAVGAGIVLGRLLRFPARQLTGTMAVGAFLSLTGWIEMDIPQWLVNLAQVVVGAALGMRFKGSTSGLIAKGALLALLSVGGMLTVAAVIAWFLAPITGETFEVMLISFAPGGVTEMALVALSLPANPALVTLYHILRILITVLGLSLSARWFKARL